MRNRFLILGIAMSGLAMSQTVKTDSTCVGITTKGISCKIKVNVDSTNYCHYHNGTYISSTGDTTSVICGENTSKNTPCKLKTKHESGHCHHHRTK
jgi:hypothetical protein